MIGVIKYRLFNTQTFFLPGLPGSNIRAAQNILHLLAICFHLQSKSSPVQIQAMLYFHFQTYFLKEKSP